MDSLSCFYTQYSNTEQGYGNDNDYYKYRGSRNNESETKASRCFRGFVIQCGVESELKILPD